MKKVVSGLAVISFLFVFSVAIINILFDREVKKVIFPGGSGIEFQPRYQQKPKEKSEEEEFQPHRQQKPKQKAEEKFQPHHQQKPKQKAEEEVRNYYSNINNGRYQAAWDRLPTAIQKDKGRHPKGFKSFEEWYESMNSVDVKEVNVAESNSDSAEVNARIAYNFKDDRIVPNSLKFLLFWDSQAEKWRITEIKRN
ncbi:MAG: hypothetical protein AAF757_00890 [Cyanobacteria bacterium P01_D01_bin.116]